MKKFKILFDSVEAIEAFLQEQGAKGLELTDVNKLSFSFKESAEKYKYFVYFVGYKREASQESLIEELVKNDIEYFYYSFNRLNSDFYKLGKAKKMKAGFEDYELNEVYKDEVLIVKCPLSKLGAFNFQPDEEDLVSQAKSMEKTYLIVGTIVFVLTLFSLIMTISRGFPLLMIVLTILLLALTTYYFLIKKVYLKIWKGRKFLS